MSTAVNYHNKRDKFGRFAPKSGSKAKRKPAKKLNNSKLEVYEMFILDKSGSMSTVRDETISGFNSILEGIKKTSRDTKIPSYCSLIQFDYPHDIKLLYLNSKVEDCISLNWGNYTPRGNTALYDAIGYGINQLKSNLGSKLNDKSIQVTVSILTDGQENSSKEYNSDSIKKLITEMRDNYNWTINFIGAGEEQAVKNVAQNMGIFASNTMNFTADSLGTQSAFNSYTSARSASTVNYAKTKKVVNTGFFSNDEK